MPRQRHAGTSTSHVAEDGPSVLPDQVRSLSEPAAAAGESGRPSRRAVLRGAAGAGAASVAASALAGLGGAALAAQGTARGRASRSAETGARAEGAVHADSTGEIVVHVKDAAAGRIDIFRETTLIRLHDPELAARLVSASRA